jgi:fucose permease
MALAFLAFVSLGLPDGLLGVAWPSISIYFGIPLNALGVLLVTSTAGYVLSSACSGRILSRINVGALLALSCGATAASLLGYAGASWWSVMVAFTLLAGLGAGAIDAGLNTYVATHHSPRTLNWLHACYGVGAAAGPVVMTMVLAAHQPWQRGYAMVAAGQLVLAAAFALSIRWWPASAGSDAEASATPAARSSQTLKLPVVWVSIAAFFVYVGLEAALGAWTYSLFTQGRGISMHMAGFWLTAYWGGLTAGRLLFGLAAGWAPVDPLLRVCLSVLALATALIWLDLSPLLSCGALALAGLVCGPVFPSLIATTPSRVGLEHTANAVGFQVAGAALGQSLLPAVIGFAVGVLGLEVIGPIVFAAAGVLIAIHNGLMRLGRSSPLAEVQPVRPVEPSALPDL